MRSYRSIAPVLAVLLLGCARGERSSPATQSGEQLSLNEVSGEPQMQHRRYIDFGGKVELLGFDLDAPETSLPGSTVTLKMYWRRTGELRGKWRLFTHLANSDATFENFDRIGPLRELETSTPETWEPHKIYVDLQTLKIPEKPSAEVTVLVGLWQGRLRLPILSGPHDAQNRGIVLHLKTR